jgi:hypothetical protein
LISATQRSPVALDQVVAAQAGVVGVVVDGHGQRVADLAIDHREPGALEQHRAGQLAVGRHASDPARASRACPRGQPSRRGDRAQRRGGGDRQDDHRRDHQRARTEHDAIVPRRSDSERYGRRARVRTR